MRTLDRYILIQILKPLSLSLGVVLVALLLERMLRLMDLLVNKGGPLGLVLKMMVNLVPHYLGMALPAAFFLSVLFVISRLGGDSEIEAMQGCGVSARRLIGPVLALGLALTAFSVLLFGYMQPYARYAYRSVFYIVTHAAWDAQLEEGAFLSTDRKLTMMAQKVEGGGTQLARVFVSQEAADGTQTTTTAREGTLSRGGDGYRLRLKDGVQIQAAAGQSNAKVTAFEEFTIVLDLEKQIEPFRERGGNEREMTLLELWRARNGAAGVKPTRIQAELNGRVARIASVAFLPLLALPLGLASRRQRRSYGVLVAALVLIAYHHTLQYGETLVDEGRVGPLVGLWGPFAVFAGLSAYLFYLVGARPGSNPLAVVIERIEGAGDAMRGLLLRLRQGPA